MKKRYFIIVLLWFLSYGLFAQAPVVYFNFLSHNEETVAWDNQAYYNANRTKIIAIANYFASHGITWNMQSDWRYLSNVITNEIAPLTNNTNNKSILRWMHEDKGVEMDPHAHESIYLYPDVVKLMDSIGLPESKIMGGSIYNDSNGVNIWTNLINGQYGAVFPTKFWEPSYMMGGGTPNHVNDLKYFGFWNPQSPSNYLVHDTATHLVHFGVGCPMKIRDTTDVASFVAQLRDIVQKVKTGQYPTNGFYYQSVFFGQGELTAIALNNKILEIADSMNVIVASGDAQWKTMKQTYTIWESTQQQMFQWECGQVANATSDKEIDLNKMAIYPSPAFNELVLSHVNVQFPVQVFDLTGLLLINEIASKDHLDIHQLKRGLYFIKNGNQILKFIKN